MNKNVIVIYTSIYGATKLYAEWIAETLNAELKEASTVKPETLQAYDTVIYGGGLYAGGIAGVKLVTQNPCKNLVVFTVGLADPNITDYSTMIQKNFTPQLLQKTNMFHLRGSIDYKTLGLIHKVMMFAMKTIIQKKSETERNAEDKEFLNTYGAAVDFTNRTTIEPIISLVKSL